MELNPAVGEAVLINAGRETSYSAARELADVL